MSAQVRRHILSRATSTARNVGLVVSLFLASPGGALPAINARSSDADSSPAGGAGGAGTRPIGGEPRHPADGNSAHFSSHQSAAGTARRTYTKQASNQVTFQRTDITVQGSLAPFTFERYYTSSDQASNVDTSTTPPRTIFEFGTTTPYSSQTPMPFGGTTADASSPITARWTHNYYGFVVETTPETAQPWYVYLPGGEVVGFNPCKLPHAPAPGTTSTTDGDTCWASLAPGYVDSDLRLKY